MYEASLEYLSIGLQFGCHFINLPVIYLKYMNDNKIKHLVDQCYSRYR